MALIRRLWRLRQTGLFQNFRVLEQCNRVTQIFDRPLRGREFFEGIIRDNLDLGRPDRVQLIFDRVVTKKTPGEFRTRVIQAAVCPAAVVGGRGTALPGNLAPGGRPAQTSFRYRPYRLKRPVIFRDR